MSDYRISQGLPDHKESGRRNADHSRIWLSAGIFGLALLVRGLYLYDSSDNPTFRAPIVDSLTYDQMARELAELKSMNPEFFWQQFFYPFFLSIVYLLSGGSIVFAKIVQALLGCFTCVLTYRLGERIFGRSAGLLAGCITALYGPLVFFEAELLAAGWASFWSVVLILLFMQTAEKKGPCWCFLLGLCAGLSVITRPNFIPFLFAAGLWLGFVRLRERAGSERLAIGLAALVGGFCVATMPAAGLNYRLTNRFSFMPGTGGLNLYIGNNPDFEAAALRPGLAWEKVVKLPAEQGYGPAGENQSFFYRKTLGFIRRQPMSFLKGIGRKFAEFTSSREMPGNIDLYLFRRWSPLLRFSVRKIGGFGFPFGVLLPLAALGLFWGRQKIPAVLLLFLILYPASVVLTHIEARYRIPVIAPMCVLAGAALVRIGAMVRAGRWGNVAAGAIFCVGAAFVCSIAGPFYSERQVNYEAEMYYGLGDSLDKRGRSSEGIEAYLKAISLRSDYVEAHHNVGLLLLQQQHAKEATGHLSRAVELEPGDSVLHKDLGNALFVQGDIDGAMAHYQKAIQIDPRNARAHARLGLALESQGKLDAAVEHYQKALELEPNDAETCYSLGVALQVKGRPDEATRLYKQALAIQPDFVKAHSNLGVIFARQGKFEDAERHLREAARIKPDSAEVYYNLGLALVSQGRINEAAGAFRQAVAIDPQDRQALKALQMLLRARPAIPEPNQN